jgi:hypothetical protein
MHACSAQKSDRCIRITNLLDDDYLESTTHACLVASHFLVHIDGQPGRTTLALARPGTVKDPCRAY